MKGRPMHSLFATVLIASLVASTPAPATQTPSPARPVSLREALQLAAQGSPDVAAARAQEAVARAGVRKAWSAWKPSLEARGQFVRTNAPASLDLGQMIGLVGGVYGLPPQNPGLIPGPVEIVGKDSVYGTVELSQPLFTPEGAFLIAPAKAAADAARLQREEAQEQILLATARTFLSLRAVEELWAAAREAEGVALRREEDAKEMLGAGMSVEVALLRAQTETASARAQLAELEGNRDALLAVLEALAGERITPAPEEDTGFALTPAPEDSEPWTQTFAVMSAAKQVVAAEGLVRYDHFAWLPTVAAVARGNYNSNAGFTGKNESWDLILAVNVPLYDRGLRYAAKAEDEAKRAAARALLDSARRQARANWLSSLARLRAAEAALAQATSQAQLAARAQTQVEAAYKEGVGTSLELSDADARRYLAQSAAAHARAQVEIRKAELAAAEGRLGDLAGIE